MQYHKDTGHVTKVLVVSNMTVASPVVREQLLEPLLLVVAEEGIGCVTGGSARAE